MLDGMNDLTNEPGRDGALALPGFQTTDVMVPVDLRPVEKRVIENWSNESKVVAAHEAGHVTVASLLGLPIKAVTVEGGRHSIAGHTEMGLGSEGEFSLYNGAKMTDLMAAQLGGYAAEVVILGSATSGCSQDIADATATAHSRTQAGLDPTAPFISEQGLGWNGAPDALKTALLNSIQTAMIEQRDRALHLIQTHKAETYKFAGLLFQARRLDTDRLDAALLAAGLPVRPRA
jgi:cell division protease FtsH